MASSPSFQPPAPSPAPVATSQPVVTSVANASVPVTPAGSLIVIAIACLLISAWGGLVPYLGPSFGFSADGQAAWHWTAAQGVLGLLPGAVGVVMALWLVSTGVSAARVGSAAPIVLVGLILIACGAWFVVGPLAYGVLHGGPAYFVPAPPLRSLEYRLGYTMGPGVLLAAFGGAALGRARRRASRVTAA
jgi:hypothetical protein